MVTLGLALQAQYSQIILINILYPCQYRVSSLQLIKNIISHSHATYRKHPVIIRARNFFLYISVLLKEEFTLMSGGSHQCWCFRARYLRPEITKIIRCQCYHQLTLRLHIQCKSSIIQKKNKQECHTPWKLFCVLAIFNMLDATNLHMLIALDIYRNVKGKGKAQIFPNVLAREIAQK